MASQRERKSKKREERIAKERVEKEKRRKKMIKIGTLAVVLAVVGITTFILLSNNNGSSGYIPADSVATNAVTGQITIPVSDIGTTAKFSTYDAGGTAVRFFEVKGPDGNIHVATDACDVCYANHKGYIQTGTSMTCNNCGKVFQIDNIGTQNTAGGCWPSYLPANTDAENVTINNSDLGGKAFMFQ